MDMIILEYGFNIILILLIVMICSKIIKKIFENFKGIFTSVKKWFDSED